MSISSLLKNREQLQATFMHSPFTPTNNMVISKADEEFLKKLNNLIQTNMQNPEFSLIDMADQLCEPLQPEPQNQGASRPDAQRLSPHRASEESCPTIERRKLQN